MSESNDVKAQVLADWERRQEERRARARARHPRLTPAQRREVYRKAALKRSRAHFCRKMGVPNPDHPEES